MDKIINDRYSQFKNYCLLNLGWLKTQKLPLIKHHQKKKAILIEFRELPTLFYNIKFNKSFRRPMVAYNSMWE